MKTWAFISLRKFRKLQNLLCFFGFQWPDNRLKMMSASLNDQNYPRYPLVLKLNVTLAQPLHLVILYFFKWKILSADRRLYLHNSKWNSRSDVDGLTHTKQLLNLLCIVYFGCSKEPPHWDSSFVYPQNMFKLRKKIISLLIISRSLSFYSLNMVLGNGI